MMDNHYQPSSGTLTKFQLAQLDQLFARLFDALRDSQLKIVLAYCIGQEFFASNFERAPLEKINHQPELVVFTGNVYDYSKTILYFANEALANNFCDKNSQLMTDLFNVQAIDIFTHQNFESVLADEMKRFDSEKIH
jgi:hypothetical protein